MAIKEKEQQRDDEITKILKALSDRMPWPVAKATLQSLGLHVSTGCRSPKSTGISRPSEQTLLTAG